MSPRILLKHPGWRGKKKSLPLQLKCSCKGQNGKYKHHCIFALGCHNHQHLLKMARLPALEGSQVWFFVFETVRKQCLPRQLASQWDCQRKTQLSRANTDHTIKLHQSGKHLIYNWTFPETSPWISLSHSSATQPAQVCSSYIMAAPIPLVHPRGHLWHHRNSHAHRYITIKDLFLSTWGVSLTTQVKQALGGPGMQGRTTVPLKFPKATLSQWGTGIGR